MASSNLFLKAINDVRKQDGVRELGTILAPKGKLSLFYALELARNYQMIGNENTNNKFRYLMKQEKKQEETVSELMRKLELDGNEKKYGIEKLESVQAFWDTAFPGMFRIVAFDVRAGLKPIFKGKGVRKYEVCVIANKGHWDGIKSAKRFFNVRNYCVSCEVSYDRPERHSIECRERCKYCCRVGIGFPCVKESGVELKCGDCNRDFYNSECFEAHKKQACKEYKKCKKCGEVSQTRSKHVCGGKFCKLCKIYHQGRQCHIQKIRQKQILPRYRIVAYDMETTANEAGEHIPNLISAIVTCSECEGQKKNNCGLCVTGPRMHTWSAAEGTDPLNDFIDWILGFRKEETIAFAHYAGRYDSHFVLTGLVEKGYAPQVSMNDLKIYQIRLVKLYFRDFWMLSQNKLADLPKSLRPRDCR